MTHRWINPPWDVGSVYVQCENCGTLRKPHRTRKLWLYRVDMRWTLKLPDCQAIAADR